MAQSDGKKRFIDETPELKPDDPDFTILPNTARESDIIPGVEYYARVANVEPYGVFVSLADHNEWDRMQGMVALEDLLPLTEPNDFVVSDEVTVALMPDAGEDDKLRFKMMSVLDTVRNIDIGEIDIAMPGESTQSDDSQQIDDADTYRCPECSFTADHPNVVRTHITWVSDRDHDTRNGFLDDDLGVIALSGDNVIGTIESPGDYPNPDWVDDYFEEEKDTKKHQIYRTKLARPGWSEPRIAESVGCAEGYPYSILREEFGTEEMQGPPEPDGEEHRCLCGKEFGAQSQISGHQAHCDIWSLYLEAGKPDSIDSDDDPEQIEKELRELTGESTAEESITCLCGMEFDSVNAKRGHQATCELWHRYKKLGKPDHIDLDADPETIARQLDGRKDGTEADDTSHSTHEKEKSRDDPHSDDMGEHVNGEIPVYLTKADIRELLQKSTLSDSIGEAAIDALLNYDPNE